VHVDQRPPGGDSHLRRVRVDHHHRAPDLLRGHRLHGRGHLGRGRGRLGRGHDHRGGRRRRDGGAGRRRRREAARERGSGERHRERDAPHAGRGEGPPAHSWTITVVPSPMSSPVLTACHPSGTAGSVQRKRRWPSTGERLMQPWLRGSAEDVVPVGDVERITALEILDVGDVAELVGAVAAAEGDAVDAVALARDVVGISGLQLLAAPRRASQRGPRAFFAAFFVVLGALGVAGLRVLRGLRVLALPAFGLGCAPPPFAGCAWALAGFGCALRCGPVVVAAVVALRDVGRVGLAADAGRFVGVHRRGDVLVADLEDAAHGGGGGLGVVEAGLSGGDEGGVYRPFPFPDHERLVADRDLDPLLAGLGVLGPGLRARRRGRRPAGGASICRGCGSTSRPRRCASCR
jgi:hypothetical protein